VLADNLAVPRRAKIGPVYPACGRGLYGAKLTEVPKRACWLRLHQRESSREILVARRHQHPIVGVVACAIILWSIGFSKG
jgi:hypothetical protein